MASELLQEIRRACSAATWSKAVELARAANVSSVAERPGEIDLRVATDGGLKSALVTLYPEDAQWSCECDSNADACVHAAAAAIAWNRSKTEGKALAPSALAHIGYRLRTEEGALVFDRVIAGATEEPLRATLAELSRSGSVKFAATTADMTVEVVLGTRPRGPLVRDHWRKLWPALRECEDVRVDGEKVTLTDEAALAAVVVDDARDGFSLTLEPRKDIDRTWANGLALAANTLFLSQPPPESLRAPRVVPRADAAELMLEILPRLREQAPVVIRTERLEEPVDAALRVAWSIEPQGPGLSVLATLVYDAPPGRIARKKPAEEQRMHALLQTKHGVKAGVRRFVGAEDAPAFLASLGAERLVRETRLFASTQAGVLTLSLSAGKREIDHATLLHALRGGQSLIALGDGYFAELPSSLRDLDLVARLLHGRAALQPSERVEAVRLLRALDVPPPPDLAPLRALLDGELPRFALPGDLQATLRDYQQEGVAWLAFMRQAGLGALLADDMGLGKTLQTIASLPREGMHLVVAPTSVLGVWEKEIARFRPALRVCRYHGVKRKIDSDANVVLTSYGTLRQDKEALAARSFATVVLDEAQAIKNPDSLAARACFALQAEHRVALSGTPIENSLDELWSVFRFLSPGYLASRDDDAPRMRERVRPFILRRKKEQVARDLPPRTDSVLLCEQSAEERAIYDATHAATVPQVLTALDEDASIMSALEALLRLRQAACHPRLLPGYEAWEGGSAKLDALLGSLETLVSEGHKALVFSQWTRFLDIAQAALLERGIAFSRLDGSTVDRDEVVRAYEAEGGAPVMLISLKAGGTGLTLTSADYVFLLDPWWNPAVEEQAAARAHRIGQTKPVFVYRMIAKGSVEEKLLALQERKRALFDTVLGDDALSKRMSRDDLRALLQ